MHNPPFMGSFASLGSSRMTLGPQQQHRHIVITSLVRETGFLEQDVSRVSNIVWSATEAFGIEHVGAIKILVGALTSRGGLNLRELYKAFIVDHTSHTGELFDLEVLAKLMDECNEHMRVPQSRYNLILLYNDAVAKYQGSNTGAEMTNTTQANTVETPKFKVTEIENSYFRVEAGDKLYVVAREFGVHPESEMPFGGRWVMRDFFTGDYIDSDQYRIDLFERQNLKYEPA